MLGQLIQEASPAKSRSSGREAGPLALLSWADSEIKILGNSSVRDVVFR